MIKGTGIDVVEVGRIAKAMERSGFAERVFSQRELAFFARRNGNPQTAAGGFAAKEAVAKALGTGFGVIALREVEILHGEKGEPYAQLSGAALARLEEIGARRVHVSISHIASVAVAQAIAED